MVVYKVAACQMWVARHSWHVAYAPLQWPMWESPPLSPAAFPPLPPPRGSLKFSFHFHSPALCSSALFSFSDPVHSANSRLPPMLASTTSFFEMAQYSLVSSFSFISKQNLCPLHLEILTHQTLIFPPSRHHVKASHTKNLFTSSSLLLCNN